VPQQVALAGGAQTSLTRDAEQELMKALHGDDQAAAIRAQREDSAEAFT
jgi:hypothetical protein